MGTNKNLRSSKVRSESPVNDGKYHGGKQKDTEE